MSPTGRRVGSRPRLKETEKRKVWVRSGGRCAICNRDLLDGALTSEPVSLGELAHVVGQKESSESPRGTVSYPTEERDRAENIILACGDCHSEIDDPRTLSVFTVEKLWKTKRGHEERIKHLTGLERDNRTVVLRMIGRIKGRPVQLSQRAAVEAVIASTDRYPYFKLAYDRIGVEIDLRSLPGEMQAADRFPGPEAPPTELYYDVSTEIIDEVIDGTLRDGLAKGLVDHVSVFAFARLPLLVYLGSRLGDGYFVDIYQRQQSVDSWVWSDEEDDVLEFMHSAPGKSTGGDGCLLVSISGTVHGHELPIGLSEMPRFEVAPVKHPAAGGTIDTRATLANLELALRKLFAEIERNHTSIERMHVFAALPISAAVVLGRVSVSLSRVKLVTYDYTGKGAYEKAITL